LQQALGTHLIGADHSLEIFTDCVVGNDLTFRFAATGPTGGSGNLHINQLQFNGTVAPEPSRALLAAIGLGGLLLRRRRS
jgi:MYXO-CTERM domain-containing protein